MTVSVYIPYNVWLSLSSHFTSRAYSFNHRLQILGSSVAITFQPSNYTSSCISGTLFPIAAHSTQPILIDCDHQYHAVGLSCKSSPSAPPALYLHMQIAFLFSLGSARSLSLISLLARSRARFVYSIRIYHYSVHWITLSGVSNFYIGCIYLGME